MPTSGNSGCATGTSRPRSISSPSIFCPTGRIFRYRRGRRPPLPSPVNQARTIHDVLALAKRENYPVNLIEAYDQPWKRQLEGTVGGHWGLYDAYRREAKFAWGGAVSNHPHWRWQAAAGIALGVLVCAAA